MQQSASSTLDIVTKPNPRDSRVHGSTTRRTSSTFPSVEKCFSRSRSLTRAERPVTYKLFPGFSTSLESQLLDRLLETYLDLDTDLLYRSYEGEREYLDLLEYDIVKRL